MACHRHDSRMPSSLPNRLMTLGGPAGNPCVFIEIERGSLPGGST